MPEPRGEDEPGDHEEAPMKSGHEEPSALGCPTTVSFVFKCFSFV